MSRSDEKARERIPIPPTQRWETMRLRVVPAAVFSAVVLAFAGMWHAYVALPKPGGRGDQELARPADDAESRPYRNGIPGLVNQSLSPTANTRSNAVHQVRPTLADAENAVLATVARPSLPP